MVELFANSGDPDQMLHSAASDLGLHCLPVTLLGISRLQWVKAICKIAACDILISFYQFSKKIRLGISDNLYETPSLILPLKKKKKNQTFVCCNCGPTYL